MPRNKHHLQLALYARPKYPGTYHYALFTSSKCKSPAQATKHHVKNTLQSIAGKATQPWRYERTDILDVRSEHRLLARVVIAKVISVSKLESILAAVPIYQVDDPDQEKAQAFNCRTWIRLALEQLQQKGVLAGLGDWESIDRQSVEYVERKAASGRWNALCVGEMEVPMLSLLENREIVG